MCVSVPHRQSVLIVFAKLHVGLKDTLLHVHETVPNIPICHYMLLT